MSKEIEVREATTLISKEDAVNTLLKFYEFGYDMEYSNSELSRISSCVERIKSIQAVEPTPLTDEEIEKMTEIAIPYAKGRTGGNQDYLDKMVTQQREGWVSGYKVNRTAR